MFGDKKQDSIGNDEIIDSDRADQSSDGGLQGSSSSTVESGAGQSNGGSGLAERLTDILVDEGDGDLLLHQNDREDRLLQWLQAMDLQVIGACRADERLKPLLKLNVSGGAAEDRLLAHLNQHFEATEVGMLARCLCIPLVSVRVGKILKEGTLLRPTAIRGNLNLTLLPTSDLRISFIGDDGGVERLATLRSIGQRSMVTIEEISADSSGRSFILKVPDDQVFYFWCSEKSKLLGNELLAKMKNLLQKTLSLADLTGISEARLDCFATHLRAYLIGSAVNGPLVSSATAALDTTPGQFEAGECSQIPSSSLKSSRARHYGSQAPKANLPYQGSLSPRSSSFKEGLPRNSALRTTVREKLRKRGDSHLSAVENFPLLASISTDGSSSFGLDKEKASDSTTSCPLSASSFLESLGKSTIPPFLTSGSQGPPDGASLLSPYYCWCPPCVSPLQYTVTPLQYTVTPLQQQMPPDALSLPPLSSFLPAARSSSVLNPVSPLDLSVPSVDFPALLPEPLVRMPFSSASSQQIPTFTPLMCDPIVHVPVIDVCSSGQGYLVSAGSAMSTIIPPLRPKMISSLVPEADSMVDKGARETLRLLISNSSQTAPRLMDALPAVLTSSGEKQGVLVTGSRGLYNGTQDVGTLANSIAAMGLASFSRGSYGESVLMRRRNIEALETQRDRPDGPVASDDQGSIFSDLQNERPE